ncbi:MAG: cupin domain-containing protein [Planctomycetaceae bacterium]|nr:cupin domain-containing protein [Planctomycetaceae bacterium]
MSGNLFKNIPDHLPEELLEVLATCHNVRIERIVSQGHSSPDDFWYDQDEAEWVLLLAGAAQLTLQEPDEIITLQSGDYLLIPAHRKHHVDWTSPEEPTIWLAVFFKPEIS